MLYIVESKKSIDEVSMSLENNIKERGFGILHMHNLEETMRNKGIRLGEGCRIYEICNPKIAEQVLNEDMSMNMVLPCRISVYTDKGVTKIGMISPSTLIHESSHEEELKEIAKLVEEKAKAIINRSS
jgi:uncharacterized protein (DUF302 family)